VLTSAVALGLALNAATSAADSPPDSFNAGTLTATGRVLFSDGSPAANAKVSALGNNVEWSSTVRADAHGRFQLRHVFGNYCGIHASTPDWRQQAWLAMPAGHARSALARPIELKLARAREQRVLVKSAGQPANGVRLVATGTQFKVEGTSGPDGRASLWLPQDGDWNEIIAWDPKLGGGEIARYGPMRPTGVLELQLHAPRAHTIRVVDQNRNPIRNLQFSLACSTPSGGFSAHEFDNAIVRTDSKGEVTVPWIPADVSSIDLQPRASAWKVDAVDMASKTSGVTTVRIRRRGLVTGRLILPQGASAEGILVQGDGFGTSGNGDIFYARVRHDGTFTFRAASNHGYAVGISDDDWACDLWTGVVLTSDAAEPADVTLRAYPATPLAIHATWGSKAEPWTSVFLYGEQTKDFEWTNSFGQVQSCQGCLRSHCPMSADGVAQLGVGRGDYKLHFSSGPWRETRTLNIASDEPVSVTLHRPWKEHHEIAGRLTHNGLPYRTTSATVLRAWSIESSSFATPAEAKLLPDKRFTVAAETDRVCLYAADSTNGLNAFRWIDQKDPATDVELALVPTGVYSGQVVNEEGKPMIGCRVRLLPQALDVATSTESAVLAEAVCDAQGRFTFERAPTGVTLWPRIVASAKDSRAPREFRCGDKNLLLQPGERRQGDRLQAMIEEDDEPDSPTSRHYDSAADHLADLIRDARVLNLKVLVGALGDAADTGEEARQHLLDAEEVQASRRYLPLWIAAGELQAQSKLFSQLKLRPPKAGEMLLVVLDGEGHRTDFLYLTVRGTSSVFKLGAQFLKKYAPTARDAQKLVAAARHQARATGRRVWIVCASSRVERSFRMVRWLQSQHALLDRDYVFVQLLSSCDEKVDEVRGHLGLDDTNAPWFGITDAAGKILAKSDTPGRSNVYPDTADAKRHFRDVLQKTAQKLTPAEIDRLMQSLGE
jgi:hypothetical protein